MIKILFLFCAVYGYRTPLPNKVDPRCYKNDFVRVWVYFTDKGISTDNYHKALQTVKEKMNKLSLERRKLRGGVIDYDDIPLNEEYVEAVEELGGLRLRKSKWLNAASYWIAKDDIDEIAALDFVYKITPVAYFKPPVENETAVLDTELFGLTYKQLQMFNIDSLHNRGIFGSNIKIGILDTGLRRVHTALDNVRVIAEHDFIDGDQIYMGDTPITERSGICSDLAFLKTGSRLNLFFSGDTIKYSVYPVRDIFYTYSTDEGNQWQPLIKLTDNFNNWVNAIDVCGNDTMFIFYRDRYGIKYIAYHDTVIASASITGQGYWQPSVVQVNDTVYITYQQKNYLYLNKGNAGGFIQERIIDSCQSSIKEPKILSNNSELAVFYHTYPEDTLYLVKGAVSDSIFIRTPIGNGESAEAINIGDTIFLVWKDATDAPLFKVAFARSTDFGDSFTSTILSDAFNSIEKISIEKFNSTITVMWSSAGKIYFRTSFDDGITFSSLDSLNQEFVYLPTLGSNSSGILNFYCSRGDSITDDYTPGEKDYWFPHHGTKMLGIIGGYSRNNYIGVAPAAQFLVAKTEKPDTSPPYEYPIEEDTWISGLEWLESRGADIVNSSLGYTEWYSWPDEFNGRTSPASIAASQAAKRGVIIVNSSGNFSVPRIVIPGDAEGVITVGGIDTLFNRWQYSGYFPTSDHTIHKPEIVSLSDAPIVVNPDSVNSYLYSSGTSGAAAMISGICALLLEGHPQWNVDSIRCALFSTASYAEAPNDSMGYGWPDALAAFDISPSTYHAEGGAFFLTPYPNPFLLTQHQTVYLPFQLDMSHIVEFRIYSINGRLIKKESREGTLLPGRYTDEDPTSPNAAFMWDGTDQDGKEVASGLYYCILITHGGGNDIAKIAVMK